MVVLVQTLLKWLQTLLWRQLMAAMEMTPSNSLLVRPGRPLTILPSMGMVETILLMPLVLL